MGKLSTFITRLKQTLAKIGEDVADIRQNKANKMDTIVFNDTAVNPTNSYDGIDANLIANTSRLFFTNGVNTPISTGFIDTVVYSNGGFQMVQGDMDNFYYRRKYGGSWRPWNQVASRGFINSLPIPTTQQINDWNTAFGWGDFRDYGLAKFKSLGNIGLNGLDSTANETGFYLVGGIDMSIVGSSNAKLINLGNSSISTVQGQVLINHGGTQANRMAFRASQSAQFNEFWHSGNFNPANFATINEINNIYDQLSAKANDRLSNVASNLSQAEKDVLLSKIGSGSEEDVALGVTAYGWGDFRDYGLGITGLNSISDIDDHDIPNGLYSVASTNTGFGSSGALLVERPGVSGYVTQKLQLINANNIVRLLIRHYRPNSSEWTPWREVVTNENLNSQTISLGFIKSADLPTNYVTTNGVQNITATKTFTQAPIVPNGTLAGHTVNLGQLNNAIAGIDLSNKAEINGSNTTGGAWKIDSLSFDNFGNYINTGTFESGDANIPETDALEDGNGVVIGSPIVSVSIAENSNSSAGWDGYLYRFGTPKPGYPANQQNGNYLIESKHRFRLHGISAPDSTSGGDGLLTVQPFNGIEHSYYRVTISSVNLLEIDMKPPNFDEITGFTIARNAIGQKCTVAVSGSMTGVKFTSVSGADFTNNWNKGVFTFYWTGTDWMFGGYSPIEP